MTMFHFTQGHLPPESFRSTSLGPLGAKWVSKEAENLNFSFVWCAVFQCKLENLKKRPKSNQKHASNASFGRSFKICAILTEKQRTKGISILFQYEIAWIFDCSSQQLHYFEMIWGVTTPVWVLFSFAGWTRYDGGNLTLKIYNSNEI